MIRIGDRSEVAWSYNEIPTYPHNTTQHNTTQHNTTQVLMQQKQSTATGA